MRLETIGAPGLFELALTVTISVTTPTNHVGIIGNVNALWQIIWKLINPAKWCVLRKLLNQPNLVLKSRHFIPSEQCFLRN
jgi:hypothetical protein